MVALVIFSQYNLALLVMTMQIISYGNTILHLVHYLLQNYYYCLNLLNFNKNSEVVKMVPRLV